LVKPSKLLKKVLSGSKNIRFDEFVALIEAFGFLRDRISGSHHIYFHPHLPQRVSIQPAKAGKAKPYQVKQFLRLIEKYELKLEMDEG
jgi:predicted RNA binding protein YcfA (HicA-like mRNA interferase family)